MNSAHILQWFPAQLVVKHTLRHYIFQVGSRTCSLSLSRSPCAPLIYRCTKSFVLVIPSTKPPITTSSGLRQRRGRTKACAICHSHFPHRMRVRIVCECFIYLRHNSSEQKRVREKHSRIIYVCVCSTSLLVFGALYIINVPKTWPHLFAPLLLPKTIPAVAPLIQQPSHCDPAYLIIIISTNPRPVRVTIAEK